MTDGNDSLAREIEQALAVDPSAELETRLRKRISAMSAPVSRQRWYLKLATAGAAAGVFFAVFSSQTEQPPALSPAEEPSGAPVAAIEPPTLINAPIAAPRQPREIGRASPPAAAEPRSQPAIAAHPAAEFYISELQGPPVPAFGLTIAPLPEMRIDAAQSLAAMTVDAFPLTSPNSGVEE
jgi:hypothetical protein